ncbi:MAG: isocitrate/isopropylmalate dehydrogenase family protein [Actinomycetota bacterium]
MGQAPKERSLKPRIAVLPGDGIGPEVVKTALGQLPIDLDYVVIEASAERYLAEGILISDEEVSAIGNRDALLFGAVGDPRVADGILERGILLRLRKELDLYVNLRPFPELGVTIVRENSEGPYSGVGGREGGVANEVNVNTDKGVERCLRFAFDYAHKRHQRVTLVHKSNVLVHAGSLWREVTGRVAAEFPEVEWNYEHADACAYHLARDPSRFEVIATDNLFGDILSDLAAGLGDGLGTAASANLHPDAGTRPTRCLGLFEPVHGSAPDIAGTGLADPTAALRAARMMLDELQRSHLASKP